MLRGRGVDFLDELHVVEERDEGHEVGVGDLVSLFPARDLK